MEQCCRIPAPDRSGRLCDKPQGHAGEHVAVGEHTLTWSDSPVEAEPSSVLAFHEWVTQSESLDEAERRHAIEEGPVGDLLAYGLAQAAEYLAACDRDQYQFWQGWCAAIDRLHPAALPEAAPVPTLADAFRAGWNGHCDAWSAPNAGGGLNMATDDPQDRLNQAVRYALQSGCFHPVPEPPQLGATLDELIRWGAMLRLHKAMADFFREAK